MASITMIPSMALIKEERERITMLQMHFVFLVQEQRVKQRRIAGDEGSVGGPADE